MKSQQKLIILSLLIALVLPLSARRMFDPQTARWMQVDPADEFHSPFVYCGNDPVKNIDPDGAAIFDTVEGLEKAGRAALKHPELQPDHQTYCNFSVQYILNKGGDSSLGKFKQNGWGAYNMEKFLRNTKNATKIDYGLASDFAKMGVTVVLAGYGHVAIAAPEKASHSAWGEFPMIYNVSGENSYKRMSLAWSQREKPSAFVLNKDMRNLRSSFIGPLTEPVSNILDSKNNIKETR